MAAAVAGVLAAGIGIGGALAALASGGVVAGAFAGVLAAGIANGGAPPAFARAGVGAGALVDARGLVGRFGR